MTVKDIFAFLNDFADVNTALSYDNVGILVGTPEKSVEKAVVCLDVTNEAILKAKEVGAQLIISHHPIIFEPLNTVLSDNLVYKCIENDIAVISMHTNLDSAKGGVNDCLAEALELKKVSVVTDSEGFSFRKGALQKEMLPFELAEYIKGCLGGSVRYLDSKKPIKTVCVCGGSGGSELDLAKDSADALITADVKHSVFIKASNIDYPIFDAGHFNTENVLINPLTDLLSKKFSQIEFTAFNDTKIKTL